MISNISVHGHKVSQSGPNAIYHGVNHEEVPGAWGRPTGEVRSQVTTQDDYIALRDMDGKPNLEIGFGKTFVDGQLRDALVITNGKNPAGQGFDASEPTVEVSIPAYKPGSKDTLVSRSEGVSEVRVYEGILGGHAVFAYTADGRDIGPFYLDDPQYNEGFGG